jgi:hypothetical protein
VQDIRSTVSPEHLSRRLEGVSVVERAFGQGRRADLDATTTLHQYSTSPALRIMSSEQVEAFAIHRASLSQRAAYGETPFGRGCLVSLSEGKVIRELLAGSPRSGESES